MTYGPISSAANVGTSLLSSYISPQIEEYLAGTDVFKDSPWLRKALAVAGPAMAAGGVGALTSGDKYGWLNAVPAGIMGGMSIKGAAPSRKAELAEVKNLINTSDPTSIARGKDLGAEAYKPMSGMPSTEDVFKTLVSLKQLPKNTTELTCATTSRCGLLGCVASCRSRSRRRRLLETDEGRMMAAMMISNMFSGIGTTASTDAYYNRLNQQSQTAEQLTNAARMRNISRALGYAAGGPVHPNTVRNPPNMYPQATMPKADRKMAASPVRREVIDHSSFKHGELVGPGDGMSDSIEANIDGKRKAKVATGEFVVPRDAADKYGDKLNKMMKAVRAAAHPKKGEQVKQDAGKRAFIKAMSGVKA